MPVAPFSHKQPARDEVRLEALALVEYEQHGKPILGVLLGEKKGKWVILNERGRELELPSARLILLPGKIPPTAADAKARVNYLEELGQVADRLGSTVDLAELWELLRGEQREISLHELTELALKEDNVKHRLALRRALLADKVFFKREKNGYLPREPEVVKELQRMKEVEARREQERTALIEAIVLKSKDRATVLPRGIETIESLAVHGTDSPVLKEGQVLLEQILNRLPVSAGNRIEDRAFELLVRIGHFSPDENLSLIRYQRDTTFSDSVLREAELLTGRALGEISREREDLTSLYTVTIDNPDTIDVDDALSLEPGRNGGFTIGIHISDVASFIPEGNIIEVEALARASSIYCPEFVIPMIPRSLSENLLSLVQGEERLALSFFVELSEAFEIVETRMMKSLIKVKKRLSYAEVDEWLNQSGEGAREPYVALVRTLYKITTQLERARALRGAVQFGRREMQAVVTDGQVRLEPHSEDSPAHRVVSELMILANHAAAGFARDNRIPFVYRSQEDPKVSILEQGLNLPEGPAREYFRKSFLKRSLVSTDALPHFGLGLSVYAQVTSPIRRAFDLLNQRQLVSFLERNAPTYSASTLGEKLPLLEELVDDVGRIQRESARYWLLKYLRQEKVDELDAVVVRTDLQKPLAEIDRIFTLEQFYPPGFKQDRSTRTKRKPGDRVRLRVDQIDPRRNMLSLADLG